MDGWKRLSGNASPLQMSQHIAGILGLQRSQHGIGSMPIVSSGVRLVDDFTYWHDDFRNTDSMLLSDRPVSQSDQR